MRNKKYLYIIPIIAFTFIFGVNNVKAENIKHIEYTEPISNISFNYNLDIDKYPYYYLTMRTKTDSNKKYLSFSLSYADKNFYYNGLQVSNCGNGLSTYCYGWLKNTNGTYNTYTIDYNISNINDNIIKNSTSNQLIALYNYENWKSYVTNFNNWLSFNSPYIDGNMPILISHDLLDNSNNLVISKDYINNNSGYNPIPEINITKFSENSVEDAFGNESVTSIVYNINFSSFTIGNFKYLYSFNTEEWFTITENDYKLLVKQNGTFYIKVTDLNNNYITSSTFTTIGIDGAPPTIEKDVNYEIDNITYQNLIKIPISYLYNTDTLNFDTYKIYFLSKSKEDVTSDFYITLLNEKEGKEIPLIISFQENLQDITKDESSMGSSGRGFYSGGGRHDTCNITPMPYKKTIHNDNTNYYNMLYLTLYGCNYTENLYLEDFSTTYIYIYYNARLYGDFESIIEDYETNPDNFEDKNKNFIIYIKNSLNYFLDPISEIFKSLTYFFNGLPTIIRYMIITLFVLGVALIIFKLLL